MRYGYHEDERHGELVSRDRREGVAYHEAGHAVVAELLAPGSVQRVELRGERGGIAGESTDSVPAGSREGALVDLAGGAAQRLYVRVTADRRAGEYRRGERRNTAPGFFSGESPEDKARVDDYIKRAFGSYRERGKLERRALAADAGQLVRGHWDQVEGVARALLAKDGITVTLTRVEVLRAMGLQAPAQNVPDVQRTAAPAGEARTMSRKELMELRSAAEKNGQLLLVRALNASLGDRRGMERTTLESTRLVGVY